MATESEASPPRLACMLVPAQPAAQLPAWQWPRAALLAGHWMQARCETCDGTGIVQTDMPWASRCWSCIERVQQAYWESGGIRHWRRYQSADLAGFDWSRLLSSATAALQGYADQLDKHVTDGWGLILTGGVGSGKTHLAVSLGIVALGMGFSTYATTLGELLMAIRAGYQGQAERSEQSLLDTVCTTEVLVLDDLGVEKPSEWARERLAYIVNQRYAAQLATIVTTNLGLDELEERWDSRVVSRLYGTCQAVGLSNVEDYRRRQRKLHVAGPADE